MSDSDDDLPSPEDGLLPSSSGRSGGSGDDDQESKNADASDGPPTSMGDGDGDGDGDGAEGSNGATSEEAAAPAPAPSPSRSSSRGVKPWSSPSRPSRSPAAAGTEEAGTSSPYGLSTKADSARSYFAAGNQSLDLSETILTEAEMRERAHFRSERTRENERFRERERKLTEMERERQQSRRSELVRRLERTMGTGDEDYFVGGHSGHSAGEDSGEDNIVYGRDDSSSSSARKLMHSRLSSESSSAAGSEEEAAAARGDYGRSPKKNVERARQMLAGDDDDYRTGGGAADEYTSFSIEGGIVGGGGRGGGGGNRKLEAFKTPPRPSGVAKLLHVPIKMLSPPKSHGTASTSSRSPASPQTRALGAMEHTGQYSPEAQKNLAPKRRWSRDGLNNWGDYTGEDEDEDSTYDYEMGLNRKRTWREALWGIGIKFASGAGYCIGSVLRALRWHYGPICSLLLSALVVVGYVAYRERNVTAARQQPPHHSAYSDLSDEDRYVIIRSRLIDDGISLHADLPEECNLDSVGDEGEAATPQYRALKWIALDDPMRLDPDDPVLPQRYALGVLFHSTGGGGGADPTSFQPPPAETEEQSYVPNGPGGDTDETAEEEGKPATWIKYYGWMSGQDMCSWAGVDCHIHTAEEMKLSSAHNHEADGESGHGNGGGGGGGIVDMVRELRLPRNGLVGTIPRELVALTHLKILDLGDNDGMGGGTLPQTIWELEELAVLRLNNLNQGGSLPSSIQGLTRLQQLDLSGNRLGGSIPPDIGNATSLKSLVLSNNRLTGTLPESMRNLWRLVDLLLDDNLLDGPVPDGALGNLDNLVRVVLRNNTLTGSVPSAALALPFLEVFDACHNYLGGMLPEDSFDAVSDLRELILCDNRIGGTIPSTLGSIPDLEVLNLATNAFTGTIPTELGTLEHLIEADFHTNDGLKGMIPDEMCALVADGGKEEEDNNKDKVSIGADCLGRQCGHRDDTTPGVTCCCCSECY